MLRTSGFLLITGHGVPADLREQTRGVAREFFALPAEVKARYAIAVGGRGWIPPGAEANGYAEGTPTPPDLKADVSWYGGIGRKGDRPARVSPEGSEPPEGECCCPVGRVLR